ncbi:hypothetical protein K439DRAFT_1645760 [Ramaria rubella]|nr:hypothetical protein K439DRAFT_1645760 [Ramaria rubella]
MGQLGNGASVTDLAQIAGVSEGSVEKYTERCQKALLAQHDQFVHILTHEEKETEKCWVEQESGCIGWREGWLMYDRTLVDLCQKPSLHGDAYYHGKCRYGINVQIGNAPTNLHIVDYSHGMMASAHDALAFLNTGATRYPEYSSQGNKFAWADSAYSCTTQMIPVHKRPAADRAQNTKFDKVVSHLQVHSEHCIGALKGCWQCLRGLRVAINSKHEHVQACHWITVAIILHNMLVGWEGNPWYNFWQSQHNPDEEFDPLEGGWRSTKETASQ